jgi:hypothetical protein
LAVSVNMFARGRAQANTKAEAMGLAPLLIGKAKTLE